LQVNATFVVLRTETIERGICGNALANADVAATAKSPTAVRLSEAVTTSVPCAA
jgi:hypothetical protein